MWGGPLPDPVQALAKMIASCTDAKGRMTSPGIYKDVKKPAKAMEASLKVLKLSEKTFRAQSGMFAKTKLMSSPKDILRSNWYLPALSVNAISASNKKDCANIINDSAWCHLGIRLVPGMNAEKSLVALKKHLLKNAPWGVRSRSKASRPAPPGRRTYAPFAAARRALKKAMVGPSVDVGCGGSIPLVGPFSAALKGAPR